MTQYSIYGKSALRQGISTESIGRQKGMPGDSIFAGHSRRENMPERYEKNGG